MSEYATGGVSFLKISQKCSFGVGFERNFCAWSVFVFAYDRGVVQPFSHPFSDSIVHLYKVFGPNLAVVIWQYHHKRQNGMEKIKVV